MGWSEPENVYFRSHDIRHILYLVLLLGDILFKLNENKNINICTGSRDEAAKSANKRSKDTSL